MDRARRRSTRRPALRALFLVLLAFACLTPARPSVGVRAQDAAPTVVVLGGLRLPAALAGFVAGQPVDHESRQPGLGHSVPYRGDAAAVDVFVYDRGLRDIPAGGAAALVRQERDNAVADVETATKMGRYKAAEIRRRYALDAPGGAGAFAAAALALTSTADRPLDSFVYVTGHGGRFVKIRYTTAAHDGSATEADRFALALRAALPR